MTAPLPAYIRPPTRNERRRLLPADPWALVRWPVRGVPGAVRLQPAMLFAEQAGGFRGRLLCYSLAGFIPADRLVRRFDACPQSWPLVIRCQELLEQYGNPCTLRTATMEPCHG